MQKILTAICLTIILSIPLHAQSTKYTAQEILNSVYVNELGNPPAFNTQYSMQNIFNAVYNDTNALRVKVTGSLTVSSLTVTGNAFSVGGSTLVVVDGKVGIGTNILFAPLSVASPDILDTPSGAITMSRKLVNIGDTRSSSIFHFYNSATNQDTLGLAVSADYLANRIDRIKMAIQLNGNVGIGTTGPEYKLDVAGTFNIPADTWMTGAGRGLIRDTHFGYSSIYRVLQVGDISVRGLALGVDPTTVTGETFTGTGEIALPNFVEFMQKNSGGTDWIQNVLVLNNGNVGIGTTGPLSRFDVLDGSITVRGTNAGVVLTDSSRVISPETSAALGAGVRISTNVYIVGFSSAGKYYGDGAGLSGITASQVPASGVLAGTLGANVIASSIAVNSVYDASIVGVSGSKVSGNISGNAANITGNLAAAQVAAGSLGASVIASSIAVNAVYPAAVLAGTYGISITGNAATATGAPPTGAAGGALSGTYPNPGFATSQSAAVTWSGAQTFSGGANFPGSGIWNTSGNVGIGTTTPQGLLHVGAGATPGLLVTSAGDVGIGTTNPAATLEVVGQFRPQQVAVGSIAALAPRGLGNVIVCTTCTNPYSLCISTSATVAGSWILVNTASSHCQ